MTRITIGTDPELFVVRRNGKAMSAYQALGGDIDYQLPHGTLVPDGAAIEFTVTPSDNPDEVARRVFENIKATHEIVQGRHPGTRLTNLSCVDVKHLIRQHPPSLGERCSLQVFGCKPDLTFYDDPWQRPSPLQTTIRSAGGHIHIDLGHWFSIRLMPVALSILLDNVLGLASVVHCPSENAQRRKEVYGRAGYVRLQESRLEYRVLPSAVLTSTIEAASAYFAAAQQCALTLIRFGDASLFLDRILGEERIKAVQRVINTHNVDEARVLLADVPLFIPELTDAVRRLQQAPVYEGLIVGL
jgi:hypothetical protein